MDTQRDSPLVIISNRGPVSFQWDGQTWRSAPSAGGLASMLTPLMREAGFVWMCGAAEPPEAAGSEDALAALAAEAGGKVRVIPLPIPEDVYHRYYNELSNEILWMLQHQLLDEGGFGGVTSSQHVAWEHGYQQANRLLADAVVQSHPDARALLVQDYHLYLLPDLLRRAWPGVPILHFTHIPFPEPAAWKLLPASWSAAILRGMLGADVVGLQTARDTRAFLAACREILGLPVEASTADDPATGTVVTGSGRRVRVRAYPASVDPASLLEEMRSERVQAARERLAQYEGQRLIVRADRLDPAKNQLAGFRAFARLLETRPDVRGQTRFLAVLSPSRTDLAAYRAYGAAVVSAIEEINARFADACGGPPIILQLANDRALALAALERCDVLLANSLADGMNLVPKEWAVVTNRAGMAVISASAGVAAEAADTALVLSPRDVEGTAIALGAALDVPAAERARRLVLFRERVQAWTSRDWLAAQLADLEQMVAQIPMMAGAAR